MNGVEMIEPPTCKKNAFFYVAGGPKVLTHQYDSHISNEPRRQGLSTSAWMAYNDVTGHRGVSI